MTVEQLIKELRKQPPEAKAYIKFRLDVGYRSLVAPMYVPIEEIKEESEIVVITHEWK